jgi:hypothetical protein
MGATTVAEMSVQTQAFLRQAVNACAFLTS